MLTLKFNDLIPNTKAEAELKKKIEQYVYIRVYEIRLIKLFKMNLLNFINFADGMPQVRDVAFLNILMIYLSLQRELE